MDEATKRKIAEKKADAQRKREAKLQQEQQQQQQPDEPDWDDMVEETMEEPGMEDEYAGMFDEFEEEAETTTSTSKPQEQVTATSSHAPLNNPPPSSSTSSFTPAPTNPPPPVTLPSSTPDIYSFSHYNPDTAYRAFKTLDTESGKTKENLVMKKKLMEKHKKRESEKSSALSLLPPTPKPILGSVPTNLPNQPTLGVPSFTVKLLNGSIVHVPITASSTTPAPKVEIQQQPTGGLLSESMAVLSKIVEEEDRQKIHAASLPPKPSKASSPLANSNNSQLWVDKYSPQTFSDLLSDSKTNREVLRTLRAWDPYVFKKPKPARPTSSNNSFFAPAANEENPDPNDKRPHVNLRVILLCGPPGVGKTTLAHIIAGLAGYRVVEVNASDERTGGVLKERVLNAMESRTLSFEKGAESKPNCVILDEVDGADNKSTIQSLVNIIKQPMPATSSSKSAPYLQRPIIFICNHRFAPSLKPLLPYARIFDLNSPPPAKLLNRLKKICSFESLVAPPLVLSNLMTKSNGDIRSCLHTLQFVATKCRAASDSKTVDISNALNGSFGNGMKDRRSDMSSLQNTIFMKRTAKANKSQGHNSQVKEIFTAMDAYNDDNKTLDCMFSNVGRVSYLDPNFSRTAVAREFLSFASVNHMCVPVSAAAINVLCAVETKPDLVFNSKEDWEFRFARDKNLGLCKQFIDGLQITSRLGTFEAVSDLVPAALNMLAASTGTNSLNRVVSTVSMLNKVEKKAFDQKVGILRTLGVTYVRADQSGVTDDGVMGDEMVLSPRINKLVNFYGSEERREIPNVTREMVAYEAKVVGMRLREGNAAEFTRFKEKKAEVVEEEKKEAAVDVRKAKENTFTQPSFASPKAKPPLAKPQAPRSAEVTPPKATTFLTGLAGISKKAKNARRAASVGFAEKKAKSKKLSHSGSGELLDQVIKFKHQKGFTQAVRISSKMGDFMC
ncbi:hypothetical protein TrLO_g2779 [Triparma laevis f. longispina]|uniref:AAA+ ATPase domain-containing protein n=1 Tax=Triparma laevis f. longispina TaxID=1714387 RepID=A0A9W7FUB9_9STRA|nr:hypothetical protein TrLO_g2779 [Triparma laevis f. longispina]